MKNSEKNCLSEMENRFALIDYLDGGEFANIFLINIDNFSNFNNTYGFEYGDKILIEIAKLIAKSKPTASKLYRIDSDEFAVVSLGEMRANKLSDIASSMVSFFDQMEIPVDEEISTRASITIGVSSGVGNQILNQAKIAMKESREHSRGSYKIYDPNSMYIKKQQENVYWIHKIKDAFEKDVNPSRVVLEILEDIDSLSSPEVVSQLNALRGHGFKIAIDDFGSRSSNLSRLLEFSPDYLKIDGAFIKNILSDKKSLIIVEAMVLLCKKSNIKVIAEFVHNAEVQAKVEELGIEYSQGYYFSEPKEDL